MTVTSEELARLMQEFEAKNGPVETVPVDFKEQSEPIKKRYGTREFIIRSEKEGAAEQLRKEREAKPRPPRLITPKPKPPKPKPVKTGVKDERLAALAKELGVTPITLRLMLSRHKLSVRAVHKD